MKHQNAEIIFMEPVFKQMIWGGSRLAREWGYNIPGEDTGECWGVCAHPNGDCTIINGVYKGITLSKLWTNHRELFGGVDGDKFPLLTKIIDANADLSIQVHPNDEYARINENGAMGKTECWYILDASEDATIIVGHNAKDRQELSDMITNGRWNEFIREIPIKKGDFIQIEPGTVHAIKSGTLLLETQQNSDITYRVYDYDRLSNGKPRELHIDKSIDVITVPAKKSEECIINVSNDCNNNMNLMIDCACYKVWKICVDREIEFIQDNPFMIMSVISGKGYIDGKMIKKGDHFILPYQYGNVSINGELEIIASSV